MIVVVKVVAFVFIIFITKFVHGLALSRQRRHPPPVQTRGRHSIFPGKTPHVAVVGLVVAGHHAVRPSYHRIGARAMLEFLRVRRDRGGGDLCFALTNIGGLLSHRKIGIVVGIIQTVVVVVVVVFGGGVGGVRWPTVRIKLFKWMSQERLLLWLAKTWYHGRLGSRFCT